MIGAESLRVRMARRTWRVGGAVGRLGAATFPDLVAIVADVGVGCGAVR
jgi:hypothetical protein